MALTSAPMPGFWTVVEVGVTADVAAAAVGAVTGTVVATDVDAVGAVASVAVAAAGGLDAAGGVASLSVEVAVPLLRVRKRLANGSVDAAGFVDGAVARLAVDTEEPGRSDGVVLVGSKATTVCDGILIRQAHWHFGRRS